MTWSLQLGDNREALDGIELRAIREPLRFGHLLQRGAQAGRPLRDGFLEVRLVALQRILRLLHLQQRGGPDAELGLVYGLGDEIVGARLDGAQPVLAADHRGDHDHGHVAGVRILADAPAHFVAVESGHDDVEQNEVGAEPQLRERLDAVARGFRLVPQRLDDGLRDRPCRLVVVHDEDPPGQFRHWLGHSRVPGANEGVAGAGRGERLRRIAATSSSSCDTIASPRSNDP